MIQTAQQILDVARKRGFEVIVRPGPPPMPVLHYSGGVNPLEATEALLEALRAWRLEIIALLEEEARVQAERMRIEEERAEAIREELPLAFILPSVLEADDRITQRLKLQKESHNGQAPTAHDFG